MRNLNAILKYVLSAILMLAILGCGKSEEPKLDGTGEPPVKGFVWVPNESGDGGAWVNPNASAGYGNGSGADEDYGDEDVDTEVAAKRSSCLLYTSPSPRDKRQSRMPSSA